MSSFKAFVLGLLVSAIGFFVFDYVFRPSLCAPGGPADVSSSETAPAGTVLDGEPLLDPVEAAGIVRVLEALNVNPSNSHFRGELFLHIKRLDARGGARELNAGLKSVYSLIELGTGEPAGREHCALVQSNYSDTLFAVMVDPASTLTPCLACGQKGDVPSVCPACRGQGQCAACGGDGIVKKNVPAPADQVIDKKKVGGAPATVTVDSPCSACKGSGKCPPCEGAKTVLAKCPACEGTGMAVSKPAAKAMFDAAMSATLELLKREPAPAVAP
ncbi:MAG: hypothetical protein R6X19_03770 [Kiritimatiellia bacterium]